MNSKGKTIAAVLQARMSSSRLPGKVLSPINGIPMIGLQIRRIRRAVLIDHLVVVTSEDSSDDSLVSYLESIGVEVFRGAMSDVYSRFVGALEKRQVDAFLRLTADCPLVMPELIDKMIEKFLLLEVDYLSNTLPPTFPDGLDIEIVSMEAFRQLASLDLTDFEREHVTPCITERPEKFVLANFENDYDLSAERWTVDYPEDLEFVSRVFGGFRGNEASFDMIDVLKFLEINPDFRNQIPGTMHNVSTKDAVERPSKDDK